MAPGPLGSVAGDPDRHRGWLLCPSSVPAAAGRGLRPRVFSAHRPGPQLQVHAPACAVTAHPLAKRLQTGPAFLLQAILTICVYVSELRFCMCRLVLCGSSAGQSRRKNGLPHPGREPRGWLHAGGEKRGHLAAPGRQTKWGGCREGPLASGIGSFSHGRAAQTLGAQDFIA